MFVSQYLFIILFSDYINGLLLFLTVTICNCLFSYAIIRMSEKRCFKFLRYLF